MLNVKINFCFVITLLLFDEQKQNSINTKLCFKFCYSYNRTVISIQQLPPLLFKLLWYANKIKSYKVNVKQIK